MDRGVEALLRAYGVRLDDVESDVLASLGVTFVFPAVEIGAVGFQNVIDPVAKGLDKFGAGTGELHGTDGGHALCGGGGEGRKGDTVGLKILRFGDISPHEMIRRNGNRLFQIDDGVRHEDASFSDDQGRVLQSVREGVEAHEDLFSQMGVDQLGPVGCNVVTLLVRIDDEAVFVGIGSFPEE